MGHRSNKVSCGVFCKDRRINRKGTPQFAVFCKTRKDVALADQIFKEVVMAKGRVKWFMEFLTGFRRRKLNGKK